MRAVVGTAGWSIDSANAGRFPAEGSALERYSQVFGGVEVNSSFHRPHRPSTWARWAAGVPEGFRFTVKLPKTITHVAKLVDAEKLIAEFAEQVAVLEDKLELLLVQLPPSLAFDAELAERFFATLRHAFGAGIVCEPRHASWFDEAADALLRRMRVARASADPALGPAAAVPGGWSGVAYWRLHGAPVMYRSSYGEAAIEAYREQIEAAVAEGRRAWCMFDNTAASAATGNALSLMARLGGGGTSTQGPA